GVPDGLVDDAGLVENGLDVFLGLVLGPLLDLGIDLDLAFGLDPVGMGRVLVAQIGTVHHSAELLPILIGVGGDEDVAFLVLLRVLRIGVGGQTALDDAVDAQLGIPVAPALADDAEGLVEGQGVLQHPGNAVHLGDFDEGAAAALGLPAIQSSQDVHYTHHASPVVGEPDGVLGGGAAQE